jgi:DNA-binding HxlR family transcriptional regulator
MKKEFGVGRTWLQSALKNLKEQGFIVREKIPNVKGFSYKTYFFKTPINTETFDVVHGMTVFKNPKLRDIAISKINNVE